jgi:hypothetical protein
MTTDATRQSRRWPAMAFYAVLVVLGWLAATLTLTLASPPGKAMAIIGKPALAMAAVATANGRVVSSGGIVTIARSDDAHFVARLYAAGALIVLDAEQAGGCSGLPPRRPEQAL